MEEGGGRGGWRGRGEQIKPFTIAALFTMFYAYKFGHRVCIGWSRGRRRVGRRNRDVAIFLLKNKLQNRIKQKNSLIWKKFSQGCLLKKDDVFNLNVNDCNV